MQVTETQNEGLKRGYTMILTAKELDDKVMDKLKEAQPDIEMKGFRKGKVPLPLLKKQFGPRLMGEAMQEAVDGAMQGHLDESGDRPAMRSMHFCHFCTSCWRRIAAPPVKASGSIRKWASCTATGRAG